MAVETHAIEHAAPEPLAAKLGAFVSTLSADERAQLAHVGRESLGEVQGYSHVQTWVHIATNLATLAELGTALAITYVASGPQAPSR